MTKKTKKEPNYVCSICNNRAKYEIASMDVLYEISGEDGNEDFERVKEWDGDVSTFYCEECAKAERIIY